MSVIHKYFSIPEDSDTPDVPRDIKRIVDGQWRITAGVKAQDHTADNMGPGAPRSVLSVSHDFPAGSLMYVDASFVLGTMAPVVGYYDLRSGASLVSPQFNFQSTPTGQTFQISTLYLSGGPATVALYLTMAIGTIQVSWRYLNVRTLKRG